MEIYIYLKVQIFCSLTSFFSEVQCAYVPSLSSDELQTVNEADHKKEECIKSESETEISFSICPKEETKNESDEHDKSGPLNGMVSETVQSKAHSEQDELRSEY